jgi:hypothetical protein
MKEGDSISASGGGKGMLHDDAVSNVLKHSPL